jgi:hypothetical protein
MRKSARPRAVPPSPDLDRRMNYHLAPVVCILSDRTVKFDAVRLMVGGGGGLAPGQPCPAQFFARSPAQRAKRRARTGRK